MTESKRSEIVTTHALAAGARLINAGIPVITKTALLIAAFNHMKLSAEFLTKAARRATGVSPTALGTWPYLAGTPETRPHKNGQTNVCP